MKKKSPRVVEGKPVRVFLFARMSRLAVNGCIPVDRSQRARVLNRDERRFIVMAQVEGFSVDHALNRLQNEIFPNIQRRDWELLEELDPEHTVGKLGSKHPLDIAPESKNIH